MAVSAITTAKSSSPLNSSSATASKTFHPVKHVQVATTYRPGPSLSDHRIHNRAPKRRIPRFVRHLPDDHYLKESEDALLLARTTGDYSEHMRIALRHTFTPSDELFGLWIPCDSISRNQKLHAIISELGNDFQPLAWQEDRTNRVLRDFKVIPGMSINFSCTSSGTAANLSRMDLQLFEHTVMIARFSSYASRYWVALARLSDHVDDTLIYKWFASRGSPPSSIAATIQVNGIASQKRTVHFEHDPVPPCLMNDAIPVREIYFALDDSSTQEQRPCIVTHRIQRYNQVPPPSLTKPTDPHPTAPTAPISGPSNRPVSSPSADHLPSSAFGRKHGS